MKLDFSTLSNGDEIIVSSGTKFFSDEVQETLPAKATIIRAGENTLIVKFKVGPVSVKQLIFSGWNVSISPLIKQVPGPL